MCGFYLLLNRNCSLSVLWPNSLPGFLSSILKHLLRESLMTSTGNDHQWETEVIYWTFSGIKQAILILESREHSLHPELSIQIFIWFIFTLLMLPFKNRFFWKLHTVWVFWGFWEASHNFINSSLICKCWKWCTKIAFTRNFSVLVLEVTRRRDLGKRNWGKLWSLVLHITLEGGEGTNQVLPSMSRLL